MTKRPSQLDIARAADVSQTVVSHVLNGKGGQYGIAESTERRVRAAMDEVGYVPNIAARALRSGRNNMIGVHTFEALFPTNQDSYYFEIMIGVEEKAVELGQDLVLLTSVHQPSGDARIYQAGHNRLRITDGAVMLGLDQDNDDLARLAEEGFRFVFVGRREHPSAQMPYVTADYSAAVQQLIHRAAALGHQRIAYVASPDRREPQKERLVAARAATRELGILLDEVLIQASDISSATLKDLQHDGATLLVAESASALAKVSQVCLDEGISIPDHLSVICLDAPRLDQRLDWTHIAVPLRDLGSRAVALLIELVNERAEGDHAVVLPCPLHAGRTLVPAPNRRTHDQPVRARKTQ